MMRTQRIKARGVTLMELMIAVVIIGILSAIALPQYRQHLERSKRVDTGTVLSTAAMFMQQFMDTNNGSYTKSDGKPADLPVALTTSPPNATGSAIMYKITVATPTPNTFVLTATPRADGPMASDACGNLTLDQRGRKGITGTGKTVQDCWK